MARKPKQNQKKLDKARRRWFKRFAKKAAIKKYRRQRILGTLFLLSVVVYLTAAGYIWKLCFYLRQEKQIEYIRMEEDDSLGRHGELYRIKFSPKTGELTLYREKIQE